MRTFTEEQIEELLNEIYAGSPGHTVYAEGYLQWRYIVGGLCTNVFEIVDGRFPPRWELLETLRALADLAEGLEATTLGFWRDGNDLHIDIGDTMQSETFAKLRGEARCQISIWDRHKETEIRL